VNILAHPPAILADIACIFPLPQAILFVTVGGNVCQAVVLVAKAGILAFLPSLWPLLVMPLPSPSSHLPTPEAFFGASGVGKRRHVGQAEGNCRRGDDPRRAIAKKLGIRTIRVIST